VPLDVSKQHILLKFGFREVARKELISDKTIFQGRVYNRLRVTGDESTWKRHVGQERVITLQSNEMGSSFGTTARPKR
jgi:hypothetical protein